MNNGEAKLKRLRFISIVQAVVSLRGRNISNVSTFFVFGNILNNKNMIKTTLLIFCLTCLISLVSFSKPSTIYYNDVKKVSLFSSDTAITDTYIIELAKQDAKVHFKNFTENIVVWIINVVATPLIGWLFPTLAINSPLTKNKVKIPNNTYSNDEVYIKAYVKECNKIRRERLWLNFGISAGIYIASFIYLVKTLIDILNGLYY